MLIEGVLKTISLRGIGTLWFLPVLFMGEILFLFIIKSTQNKILNKVVLTIVLIGILYILYLPQFKFESLVSSINYHEIFFANFHHWLLLLIISVLSCVAIISIGYSLGQTIEKLSKPSIKSNVIVALIFVATLVIDFWLHRYYHCDLHKGILSPVLVYFGCSVVGSISVIMLSILLPQVSCKASKILEWFGKNSLVVMASHKEFYIVHVMYLCALKIQTNDLFTSILTIILTIIVEFFVIYIVNVTVLKKLFYIK